MTILQFVLENAPAYIVQQAVKEFNIHGIGYKMRQSIINEFPEYRNSAMSFGIALSNEFEPFKSEQILCMEINQKIIENEKALSIFSKWHPKYESLVAEHDALVEINNRLAEPISAFLKLYKKAQKAKGKNISVVKKKEKKFAKPVK